MLRQMSEELVLVQCSNSECAAQQRVLEDAVGGPCVLCRKGTLQPIPQDATS